jgi:Domain of unknown function (DUF1707)
MGTDARGFPTGDLRVSDAERDRALAELSEALQVGRITAEEFDQRSGQVLTARTGKELTAPLADLPVDSTPADAIAVQRPDRAPAPAPRFAIGASVAAGFFAIVSVANALNPGPTLQQRELFQEFMARQGVSVPIPPAQGFDWAGTITPAVIALMLVVLVILLRVTRNNRA